MNYQPQRPPDRRPMSQGNKMLIVIGLIAIIGFGGLTIILGQNRGRPQATATPAPTATLQPGQIATVEEAIAAITPTPTAAPIVMASPEPTATPVPNFQMTPAPTDVPTLKNGATGDAVRQMQTRLIELGYMRKDSNDGQFGKGTENAVRAFQNANGLGADGAAGPKTLTLLFSDQAKPKPE